MDMILYIDTSKSGAITVKLGKAFLVSKQEHGSQVLLNLVEKIVKKAGLKMEDLDEIKVATGPGSFTGLRVGVSVANALGFSLGIPVNGKQMEVDLKY